MGRGSAKRHHSGTKTTAEGGEVRGNAQLQIRYAAEFARFAKCRATSQDSPHQWCRKVTECRTRIGDAKSQAAAALSRCATTCRTNALSTGVIGPCGCFPFPAGLR